MSSLFGRSDVGIHVAPLGGLRRKLPRLRADERMHRDDRQRRGDRQRRHEDQDLRHLLRPESHDGQILPRELQVLTEVDSQLLPERPLPGMKPGRTRPDGEKISLWPLPKRFIVVSLAIRFSLKQQDDSTSGTLSLQLSELRHFLI